MKRILFLFSLFYFAVTLQCSAWSHPCNIYLKDGSILKNVRYEIEEFFGIKFVRYLTDDGFISRIERNKVIKAIPISTQQDFWYSVTAAPPPQTFTSQSFGNLDAIPGKNPVTVKSKASFLRYLESPPMRAKGFRGALTLEPEFPGRIIIFFDGDFWDKKLPERQTTCREIFSEWEAICSQNRIRTPILTFRDFQTQKDIAVQVPGTSPPQWRIFSARNTMY